MRSTLLAAALAALVAACASSNTTTKTTSTTTTAVGDSARVEFRGLQGQTVGRGTLRQTPHGVLISVELTDLPGGVHAMHLHEVGRCDPPFTSAAGHLNPVQRQHGIRNPGGFHAGDLPNFTSPPTGTSRVDVFTRDVTLGGSGPANLFDADSTAIVVHANPDDYMTDPAGNAGTRIACGVIRR